MQLNTPTRIATSDLRSTELRTPWLEEQHDTVSSAAQRALPRDHLYAVSWAASPAEVREAQQLRYRVFAEELGASLQSEPSAHACLDRDRFDPFCSHLIVRATTVDQRGQVVATCRVLAPDAVQHVGGLYAESEFDLGPVRGLLPTTLEMGRVCVHPAWRHGLIVMAMWRAVGQQLAALKLDSVIGCSSVSVKGGAGFAVQLWNQLRATHLAPENRQVLPRISLPLSLPLPLTREPADEVAIPPLIAGYLRCGGKILGPPAFDAIFETADFPMMLNLADMPARYNKRIFGE